MSTNPLSANGGHLLTAEMIELARAQNLIIEPTPYDEWWFLVDSDGRCVGEDENAMRLDEIETFLRERAK